MADTAGQGDVILVVLFENAHYVVKCGRHMTMAQVRRRWQQEVGDAPSVAFFTPNHQRLPDEQTVVQTLAYPNSTSLEVHAFRTCTFWLEVFGYENSRARFEVPNIVTPASVLREMGMAVGIHTDDFRLLRNGHALDPELSFNALGLSDGAQLMLDLRLTINVQVEQPDGVERRTQNYFGSSTIGNLRQELGLQGDTVLVVTLPYRRVLSDPLHLCHIVSNIMDLHVPIDLIAEKTVLVSFEPIALPHLRQQLLITMSSTPLDLHEMLSERFELDTDFRLSVNGEPLNSYTPLIEQHLDNDTVVQLDILRSFKVRDHWIDLLRYDDEVYLYSTASPRGLFFRDFLSDQILSYEETELTLFGSIVDVFGAISGQHRSVLHLGRDIQRSLPVLSFETVVQKLAWARSMLLDVVSISQSLQPKEVMRHGGLAAANKSLHDLCLTGESLIVLNPLKVITESEKKLRVSRFAHGSTLGDVLERMQQLKGLDIGLKTRDVIVREKIDHRLDIEFFLLTSASRFQTKITVSMVRKGKKESFGCWFEPQQVSFSDIMINVGKQAKVPPRHLFSCNLFCCGCGRKLSKEKELHQVIPSNCCEVKSLRLTDRRVKATGSQTAVPRKQDVSTYTLYPESRDACVDTKCGANRAVISATREHESVSTAPQRPPALMRISAKSTEGGMERKTISAERGSNCRSLLAIADRQLTTVSIGDWPLPFVQEAIYDRNGTRRRAVKCFNKKSGGSHYIDYVDGKVAERSSWLRFAIRLLRPTSSLPFCRRFPPIIVIENEAEILETAPWRQMQVGTAGALTDPAFVALMPGIRSGNQFFWELSDVGYVNAESGKVFNFTNEIPRGDPKRFVYVLLRISDPVPRVKVPKGKTLLVYRRDNFDLTVEKGCVQCLDKAESVQVTDIERWYLATQDDFFDKNFAAAARV